MRSVPASSPDGTQWTVRVAWEPRWRALARRFGGWRRKRREGGADGSDTADVVDGVVRIADAATPSGGGGGGAGMGSSGGGGIDFDFGDATVVIIVALLGVIVAAVLFWWVLLPLLLLVLDLVVVLMLLASAIVGRVLFRRPWTVVATASTGDEVTANVVGWRAALRRRDEIADRLRRGERPQSSPVVAA